MKLFARVALVVILMAIPKLVAVEVGSVRVELRPPASCWPSDPDDRTKLLFEQL